MIMIGIAGLLLSLASGMFLLAKTQKDNLGIIFKIISWFIIVCSLGAILCAGVRCVAHGCCKKESKECHGGMMMRDGGCGMGGGGCEYGPRHFNKRMMIMKECEDEMSACRTGGECEEKCAAAGKGECKKDEMCKMGGEKKDCCKKMEMKKDSVVIKH